MIFWDNYSEGESVVFWFAAGAGLLLWGEWFWRLFRISRLISSPKTRLPIILSFCFSLEVVWLVLRLWSSHDVRDSPAYLIFYMTLAAGWLGLGVRLLPVLGLSLRDQLLERRNPAAGITILSAMPSLALCFAGANIGEGPGWWVVVFCALLATLAWTLAWVVLISASRCLDSLLIDRDPATGLRLAGFVLAVALICGRSAAGDWVDFQEAVSTLLRMAALIPLLTAIAILLERLLAPTSSRPRPAIIIYGVIPGLGYLGLTAGYLVWRGPW